MKINLSKAGVKNFFFKYVVGTVLGIEICLSMLIYIMVLLNVPTQNGDNVEHLHSSFLVASGLVPYKDFFQHHNPLMWYLFAPVMKLFAYNATASEVISFISFLVFLKSLVYVYRIGDEFLGSKFIGVIAVMAIMVPSYKIFALDFRPDNYMMFCLMGCIYYYFSYLKHKKVWQLCVAMCYGVCSFLFAQKALFVLFGLFLSGVYFIYKKEISLKDALKAAVLPLVMLGLFFVWLWAHDMVELYFVSNYKFNLNLVAGFEMGRVSKIHLHIKVWIILAFGALLYIIFNRKNKYLNIVLLLFLGEFFQRVFYFSPYSYYYWMLLYFGALAGSFWVVKLDSYNRSFRVMVALFFAYILSNSLPFQLAEVKRAIERGIYLPDYISRRISPCDYVFNGDGLMYNIFGKDPHYYWQLIGQLDVVGEKTGIVDKPDINKLIEYYKPRFVYGKNYFNKFAEESGRKEIVHYVDMGLIEKYYQATPFNHIYELKPEFVKTCSIQKN